MPPFVMEQGNKFVGFDIDLLQLIANDNGWELHYDLKKNIDEILAAVKNQQNEIGLGGITITAARLHKVAFSQPYFDAGLKLLVNRQSIKSEVNLWDRLEKILPVLMNTLLILILVLTLFSHIIWVIERLNGDEGNFSAKYFRGIGQAYWWSIVTATTVGYGDITPKKTVGRIIAAMVMIVGVIWFGYFTGSISSIMVLLDKNQVNVSSMHNQQIGTKVDSTAAAYLKTRPTVKIKKYTNIYSACDDVSNNRLYGVFFDVPTLLHYAGSDNKVILVGEVINPQQYGICTAWDSNLSKAINISILKIKTDGRYDKLYNKWFNPQKMAY
jgi:polar amino acid transport system substrate-binding protein